MGKGSKSAPPPVQAPPAAVSEPPRNVSQIRRPDVVPTRPVDTEEQYLLEPTTKQKGMLG